MPKLDLNIYGTDDNAFAAGCSSAALNSSKLKEWEGSPTGEEGSKGGGNDQSVSKGTVVVKSQGQSPDKRAVSKGGHGATEGGARER